MSAHPDSGVRPHGGAHSDRQRSALVAGGAGFIGGNLCAALLAAGYRVCCVDSLTTGRAETVRRFADHPHFEFVEGSVVEPDLAERLLRTRYDDVFNLACPTGVPNIALLGEEMLLTSSIGSQHLLEIARRWDARYLFASSAEIYGEAQIVPQPETYTGNVDPIGARSAYEEGKRFGEALTALYARKYGVDTRIVRIFNTYGPGMSMRDQRVIPRLVASALDGSNFTIYGDGTQTRSFLYVDDLIAGFLVALDRGRAGDVFNIGSPEERTILNLLDVATEAFGHDIPHRFSAPFIRDHPRRCPDTSRIEALGWCPTVPLDEGLRRSLEEVIARYENEPPTTGPIGDGREVEAGTEPEASVRRRDASQSRHQTGRDAGR